MDKREKFKKVITYICYMGIALSNAGLCLCSVLIFRTIIYKQIEIAVFTLEMVVIFIFALELSNHFKNYFRRE